MVNLRIYSFNVRGIGEGLKRRTIFRHLKSKYPNGIYLLQETHSSSNTEQKWRMEWGGEIYFNHGTTNSCGVTVLIYPGLDLDIGILQKDDQGRFLGLILKCNDNCDIAIYNIYFPVRSKVTEQLELLSFIKDIYMNMECLYTIMGGDFNTVLNPILDKQGGDMTGCTNMYTDELLAFMEAYDFIDAIRYYNPEKKIFTRMQRSPPVLSRIDHWLISSHLCNYLQAASAHPGIKSDHSIISLYVTNSLAKKGRGFWKFNSSLLHDLEYVQSISSLIDKLKEETFNLSCKQLRWEYIKMEIRGFTVQYSSKRNKAKRELKLKLEKDLYNIECEIHNGLSDSNIEKYTFIKEELEKIEELETKGAILRSKIRWAEAGEKNTKYFLNLEKKNAIDKHICQLLTTDGETITDPKTILLEQRRFFEKLYSEPDSIHSTSNDYLNDTFVNTLPQLSEDESKTCEGLVTESECANSLKNMQNGKSPGCDGFTVEFYKVFWKNIKSLLVESINSAFEKGELSFDQKRGIITLIPKKGKIRLLLKNWRPISLLNTDYKILTKSLAIRLHKVLPSIIDLDQTGFLKGRYIGENIRTISDVIEYTSLRNQPGIILLLDFEKAFDTVKWSFILESLKLFNFGPDFIHWVEIIYSGIESTVINNGNTGGFFKLQRGIRQGCPISPYLFIIAVEILANSIRKNNQIKGICVGSTAIKISQLADDTTVFVSDLESVKNVLEILEQFAVVSGLKLNLDKTVAKCIGSLKHDKYEQTFGLHWTDSPLTTLGITISNDPQFILQNVFEPKLKTFDNVLNMWNCHGLSLKGRVTILKSLALPQLLYPMSVLPIPTAVIDIVDNMIIDFVWNKRKPKIKKDVIIQNIENGGIKAPKFAKMVEANRLSWIKRIMSTTNAKWKSILCELIKPMAIEHYIECYLDTKSIDTIRLPFYVQLFSLWNKVRNEPKSSDEYLEQVLWHNRYIQLPSNPKKKSYCSLKWPELYKAGICKVKHLFTCENKLIDLADFCKQRDIKYNFIQVIRVKKSIPGKWINAITNSQPVNTNTDFSFTITSGHVSADIRYATTQMIYNVIILDKYVIPTAVTRWTEVFDIDTNDWPSIFKQPYLVSRETKLQTLQYKIINRIVSCKKWLYDQNVIDSPNCTFCNNTTDDIIHHFIECKQLNNFWNSFELWWNRIARYKVKLTNKHILFGFYYDNFGYENINCAILIAKWYIQRQTYLEHRVDFYDFLTVLKSHLQIERYICASNNKLHIFGKKWSYILDNL